MNNLGKLAEIKVAALLRKKKYTILDFNYTSRFGEIDVIAENDRYIIFGEVKMRDEKAIALPREFVDVSKQNKIAATAQLYLSQNSTELQPRFDVFEVFSSNGKIKSIKHLENAFTLL